MAYNIFKPDSFYAEIKKKQDLYNIEKPIINQYYTESRAKLKPTIIENVNVKDININDENAIRNSLINELRPILRDQTINFIETLYKSNDLIAFYKFGKPFLNEVKDIRNLDATFLLELWNRYKKKMLIDNSNKINIPSILTAEEYEAKVKKNKPSNMIDYDKQKEQELFNKQTEEANRNYKTQLRNIERLNTSSNIEEGRILRNKINKNLQKLEEKEKRKEQLLNKKQQEQRNIQKKNLDFIKQKLAEHNKYIEDKNRNEMMLEDPYLYKSNKYKKNLSPLVTNLEQYPKKRATNKNNDIDILLYNAPYGYKSHFDPYTQEKSYIVGKPLKHLPKGSLLEKEIKQNKEQHKIYNKMKGGNLPGITYYSRR